MTRNDQDHPESGRPALWRDGGIYEIKVQGQLDEHWQQWFEGMTLKHQENIEAGQDYTLIRGSIPDQPALHGLLTKIRDLNLTLISVRKIPCTDLHKPEADRGNEQSD